MADDNYRRITGKLIDSATGRGLSGLRIELYDWDAKQSDYLGSALTDAQGEFTVEFDAESFKDSPQERGPDVVAKIYDGERLILTTEDNPIKNWTPERNPLLFELDSGDEPGDTGGTDGATHIVEGEVVDPKGRPLPGLPVKAFDRALCDWRLLGEDSTNDQGRYRITYAKETLAAWGKARADLKVEVYDRPTGDLVLAASPLILQALPLEVVDFAIGDGNYVGPDEHKLVQDALAPLLEPVADLECLEVADLLILARESGQASTNVAYQVKAQTWSETLGIESDLWYGLLRQGAPADIDTLLAHPLARLWDSLNEAVRLNIIDLPLDEVQKARLAQVQQDYLLQPGQPYRQLLDTTGLDEAGQTAFTRHLTSGELDGEALWQTLAGEEGFVTTQIEELQRTFDLLSLTDNSSLTIQLRKDRGIGHSRETAAYRLEDWLQALSAEGVEIPDSILPGEPDPLRRESYAQALYRSAESRFPTASLRAQMSRNPLWIDHDTHRWLADNPEFELRDQRITLYLAEQADSLQAFADPDAVQQDLLRLEQLFHLTSSFVDQLSLIQPLWDIGITSAAQVAAAGRDALIRQVGELVPRTTIDGIYARATHQNAFALNLYMRYSPQVAMSSAFAAEALPFDQQGIGPGAADTAEWETLFGSPDACDCEHCESTIGQAAYLVDMLVFLSRATDANGRNAQEIFLERRPDIGLLELSCDNTYKTLPQIDLFIESAEQIIANSGDGVSIPSVGLNTTWDSELLEAQQEHQEPATYELLRQARYPFSLPFDLWLEEGRRYLEQMDVPRAELMRQMPRQPGVDGAAIAAESLGLSAPEAEIITTPRVREGVLADYWGINLGLGTLESQLTQVETFLRQARIDYDRLLRLLYTRYLNPGRSIEVTFTGDPCTLVGAVLGGGDMSRLFDRCHRILRLQRRLEGWSEYDIDRGIRAFGVSDFDDPSFLPALAEVEALHASYGLPIAELTSWWEDLDTYAFEEDGESQYEAIFLDRALFPDMAVGSGPDLVNEVFALTPDRSDLVVTQSADPSLSGWLAESGGAAGSIFSLQEDYASYVQGATGLTADDLALLVEAVLPKDPTLGHIALNLANLSLLYRIASFTRALDISVTDLLRLERLIGQAPLTGPSGPANPLDTRRFIDAWETIDAGAWSAEALDYLLLHGANAVAALGPDPMEVEELLQALNAGFEGASEASVQAQIAVAKADLQTPSLIAQPLSTALKLDAELIEALLFEVRPDLGEAVLWHLVVAANPGLPAGSAPPLGFDGLFEMLFKLAMAWRNLELTTDHLEFVLTKGPGIGWTDIAAFPLTKQTHASLSRWQRLVRAAELQNTLFSEEQTLFSLIAEPFATLPAPSRQKYLTQAADWTGWALTDLTELLGPNGFNAAYPDDFRDERWLSEIERIVAMIGPLGTTVSQAHTWTRTTLGYAETQAIKQCLALAYERDTWLEVMAAFQDDLRRLRRDALLDQLLGRWPGEDAAFIHTHYFIDPAMEPCARTSRMAQAHAAVQLFAQRILLNLESTLSFQREDAEAWTWRKRYRVWQAAREVFLYPQNWAMPEVRDNKSVFFEELEDGLRQDEVTTENVEGLYREYLYKLDAVSRLEIMGLYEDEDTDTLHVFGRTRHSPRRYFYRRWEDGARWTPWESMELDIQSDHLVPIVYNGRLYLFWAEFAVEENVADTAELDKQIDTLNRLIADAEDEAKSDEETYGQDHPLYDYIDVVLVPELESLVEDRNDMIDYAQDYPNVIELRIAWSQRVKTGWQAKTTSTSAVANYDTARDPKDHFFTGWIDQDNRLLLAVEAGKLVGVGQIVFDWVEEKEYIGYFFFSDCQNGLQFDSAEIELPQGPGSMLYTAHELNALKLEAYYLELEFTDPPSQRRLLEQLPAATDRLHYAHQYGIATQEMVPFFYADDHRSYFVQPIGVLTASADANIPYASDAGIRSLRSFSLDEPSAQTAITGTHYQGVETQTVIDRTVSDQTALASGSDFDRLNALQTGPQSWDPLPHQGSAISSETRYRFTRHYHPFVCLFLKQLSRHGIDGLLGPDPAVGEDSENLYRQLMPFADFDFAALYGPTEWVRWDGTTNEEIDFDHHSAYGGYNWELFFHIPLLIAERFRAEQRFEEARRWYHFIFDPTKSDDPQDSGTERFWKIRPFYEHQLGGSTGSLSDLIALAQQGDLELERQVEEWGNDPFQPHTVARMRITAYMMYTVQGYLDLLIQWGDMLFAQDQREQVEEAKQLYLLAADILGDRPTLLPAQDAPTLTTNDLLGLSPSALDPGILEKINQVFASWLPGIPFPKASPPAGAEAVAAASGGGTVYDTLLLFCIPPNARLLGLWDKVADRLFKVRNCMNLEGQVRALALYAPPIDPGLLVKAAAAGMSIESVVNGLYASLPHYRFGYVLQKALEICGEIRALGASVLSALEKRDGEEMAVLRSSHEVQLLTSLRQLKERQIEEAKAAIQALTDSKRLPEKRLTHYRGLLSNGLNQHEEEQQTQLKKANTLQIASQITSLLGSTFFNTGAVIKKIQGKDAEFWHDFAFGTESLANSLGAIATHYSNKANKASLEGSYARRQEDWRLQQALATRELQQIDKQLVTAEIRLQVAEQDLENHDEQTARSQAVDEFLRAKFTGQSLYGWMLSELAALYFQAYDRAYQLALQAQQTYQRELGPDESSAIFVVPPYWDSLKEGLLAGERLHDTLRQMERAHMDANRRELEITKTLSLFQLDPQALLDLRTIGGCSFHVPEVLYDLDFAGHYFRRIKSVRVTIPGVVGPATNLSATLTLTQSWIRKTADLTIEPEEVVTAAPQVSIATSSGNNDSGLFELRFADSRYLPFEGCGAVSSWSLALPSALRPFPYESISDVLLHISYTARDSESTDFKQEVNSALLDQLNDLKALLGENGITLSRLASLRREFPTEWSRLLNPADAQDQTVTLTIDKSLFPSFLDFQWDADGVPTAITLTIERAVLYLQPSAGSSELDGQIVINGQAIAKDGSSTLYSRDLTSLVSGALGHDDSIDATITVDHGELIPDDWSDIYLLLEYHVEAPMLSS
jgi:hypothetical protein